MASITRVTLALLLLACICLTYVAASEFESESWDSDYGYGPVGKVAAKVTTAAKKATPKPTPEQQKKAKALGVKVTKKLLKETVQKYKQPGQKTQVKKNTKGNKVVKTTKEAKHTGKEKGADFGNMGTVKTNNKAEIHKNVFSLDNIITITKIECGINGLTMHVTGGTASDPKSLDKAWKPWDLAKKTKGTVLVGGRQFNCQEDAKIVAIARRVLKSEWIEPGKLFVTTAPAEDGDIHKKIEIGLSATGAKTVPKGKPSFFEADAASHEHAQAAANTMFLEMGHMTTHDHAMSVFQSMQQNLRDHIAAELDYDSHDAGIDAMHAELHQHMLNFDYHHALATKDDPNAMSFLETHANVAVEAEVMHEMLLNARADIPDMSPDLGYDIQFMDPSQHSFVEEAASSNAFANAAGWSTRTAAESCQLLAQLTEVAKKTKAFKLAQPKGKRLTLKDITDKEGFPIQWVKNIWKDEDKVSVRLYAGPRKGLRHIVWAGVYTNKDGQNRNGIKVKPEIPAGLFKLDSETRFYFTFKLQGAAADVKSLKSRKYRLNEFAIENGANAKVVGLAKDQFYAMGTTAMVSLVDPQKVGIQVVKCKLYTSDNKRVKKTKFTVSKDGCAVKFPDTVGDYYVYVKYGKGAARGAVRSPVFHVKQAGGTGLNPTAPLSMGTPASIKQEAKFGSTVGGQAKAVAKKAVKKLGVKGAAATKAVKAAAKVTAKAGTAKAGSKKPVPPKGGAAPPKKYMFLEQDTHVEEHMEDAAALEAHLSSSSDADIQSMLETNMHRTGSEIERQMMERVAALERELQHEMMIQNGWLDDPAGSVSAGTSQVAGIESKEAEFSLKVAGLESLDVKKFSIKCGVPEARRANIESPSGTGLPTCGANQQTTIREFSVSRANGIKIHASGWFEVRPYLYFNVDGALKFSKDFEIASVPILGLSAGVGASAIGVYLKLEIPLVFEVKGRAEVAIGQTIRYPWTYDYDLSKSSNGNGLVFGEKVVTNKISYYDADFESSIQSGLRVSLAVGVEVGSVIKLEASIGATFALMINTKVKTAGFTSQEGAAVTTGYFWAPSAAATTCGNKHKVQLQVDLGFRDVGLKLSATMEFWLFEFSLEKTYFLNEAAEKRLTWKFLAGCYRPVSFMLMETDSEQHARLPATMGAEAEESTAVERRLRKMTRRSRFSSDE